MLMRSDQDDDPIDAAIAAAARSLTAAEPSAALRAGVRDRIGGDGLMASASRRKNLWWLVPVGATAVVLVAAIVGRALLGAPESVRPADVRPSIEQASPQLEVVSRTTPPHRAGAMGTPRSGPAAPGGPNGVRRTGTSPRVRRLAATFEPPPIEELEPLIPAIAIPQLETEPLEIRQIAMDVSSGVMPIEIEPLRIEPLRGE